jgi:hypothetical protein
MTIGDWGLQRRTNMIKIITTKLGSYLMTLMKRRIAMEVGARPTLEFSCNEDHDEDFLHTITIICTTRGKTNIQFYSTKEDKLITNTIEN